MDKLVSIIIPTYKRAIHLGSCLESVLNQTYKNIEIIVVDDNEPDSDYRRNTEQIMNNYINNPKITYVKHSQNRNGAAARNTGIKLAKGKYIAFLDDDDLFFPTKIEEQIRFIQQANSNIKACYCMCEKYINERKIYETSYKKSGNLQLDIFLLNIEIYGGSTILMERDAAISINYFNENFTRHQDVEFLINFFRKYEIVCLPKVLVKLNVDWKENKLNPEKLEKVKKLLLETYQEDILKYSPRIQKKIYSAQWFDLFKVYLISRKYEKALICLYKSKPSIKMIYNFLIHLIRKLQEQKLSNL